VSTKEGSLFCAGLLGKAAISTQNVEELGPRFQAINALIHTCSLGVRFESFARKKLNVMKVRVKRPNLSLGDRKRRAIWVGGGPLQDDLEVRHFGGSEASDEL
jgi:CO dehydrogenase/acetyl-CoA synthase alpha subunit